MITRERIEAVLDRVRPFMQADGGDIELVHGEFQNAEEISDSCTGERLRDMRAQFATFTVTHLADREAPK